MGGDEIKVKERKFLTGRSDMSCTKEVHVRGRNCGRVFGLKKCMKISKTCPSK